MQGRGESGKSRVDRPDDQYVRYLAVCRGQGAIVER